jgi:hypothetical protein
MFLYICTLRMDRFATAAACTLSGAFLLAAASKAFYLAGFEETLRGYFFVPDAWTSLVAPAIAAGELWIGIGLWRRGWRHPAALVAAATSLLFLAAIAVSHSADPSPVSCGSVSALTLGTDSGLHAQANLCILTASLFVALQTRERRARGALQGATSKATLAP